MIPRKHTFGIIGLGEPVHTRMIGLTTDVKDEPAHKLWGFRKAKTDLAISIFFVELQNV